MTPREAGLTRQLEGALAAVAALLAENALRRQKVELLVRRVFGTASERLAPGPLELLLALPETPVVVTPEPAAVPVAPRPRPAPTPPSPGNIPGRSPWLAAGRLSGASSTTHGTSRPDSPAGSSVSANTSTRAKPGSGKRRPGRGCAPPSAPATAGDRSAVLYPVIESRRRGPTPTPTARTSSPASPR